MSDELDTTEDKRDPKEIAIDELANGASVVDAAKAAGVTRKAVHEWKKKDREFAIRLAAETALRAGRVAALSRMFVEGLMPEVQIDLLRRLPNMKDGDAIKTALAVINLAGQITPSIKYTESHKTVTKDDGWQTAPADDGSTIEAEVIDSEAIEGE